ncbi:putative glycolipid-binding domain-containing protein [Caballeronia sp. ATUFL_M2_KS44]|uniref:putative glycolipid-binding domain-containing protein n=1 Tax=Caballeronia sp. ATUFL_M2_KS44 TaxID=2921767 RepID=UPI0020285217|nr:putative glycolipid-binding domain-containing protein [Caballeronia sp. ATUFL_M2_KS44]
MKTVRWSQQDGTGLEHLVLDTRADGIVIESAVVGENDGEAFGLMYRIECNMQWEVTRLAVRLAGGIALDLRRSDRSDDNEGAPHVWTDAEGTPQEMLNGCIDVDIMATPFTNTLPIRRLQLQPGERRVIRVVYVSVPSMTVSAVDQAYTCIAREKAHWRYRFEGLDTGFEAEITTDDDGFVTDYPSLFRRIA